MGHDNAPVFLAEGVPADAWVISVPDRALPRAGGKRGLAALSPSSGQAAMIPASAGGISALGRVPLEVFAELAAGDVVVAAR